MRWLDLHTHTHLSADGATTPRALAAAARRAGLDGVAVTDHGTLEGALRVREAAEGTGLLVIVGAEYATDVGHVLGLFLERELRLGAAPRWPWREVLAAVREQGGLAVLAHPTRTHRSPDPEVMAAMDGVEVYNARAEWSRFPRANARARQAWEAARRLRGGPLLATAGSDAHFPGEIGHGRCAVAGTGDLRRALGAGTRAVLGRGTLPLYEAASQALKVTRNRDWPAAPRAAARLAFGGLRTLPHLAARTAATHWEVPE